MRRRFLFLLSMVWLLLGYRIDVLNAAPVKTRIAVPMPTIGTLPVWVALEKGIFAKEGLEVEVVAVSAGLDVQALVGGAVDFADSVPSPALVAAHKGADIKLIAGTLNAITYSVMGKKGLKILKDLKGKKIGVAGVYSGSTLVLHEMMAAEGLSYPQDYAVFRVGGASDRLAAIIAGQVDAVTLPIPFSLIAADQGAVRLADADEYVRHYQNTALMVRGRWAQENPQATVRFVRAVIQAMRWIYNSRDDFIEYAAKKLRMKKEYALAGWQAYAGKKVWSIDGSPTREGIETTIKHQIRLGFLPEGFKVDKYIDLSYLQRAQKE